MMKLRVQWAFVPGFLCATALLCAGGDRKMEQKFHEAREHVREVRQERPEVRQEHREVRQEHREVRQDDRRERRDQMRQEVENRYRRNDSNVPKEITPRAEDRGLPRERILDQRFDNKPSQERVKVGGNTGRRLERKDFDERRRGWDVRAKVARDRFRVERRRDHIFDNDFWVGFRRHHRHWYFNDGFRWSVAASWPSVTLWLPWGWSAPVYYYYGTGGEIYSGEGDGFSYLSPIDSAAFVQEAQRIANVSLPLSSDQSDWMPLGMFAIAPSDQGQPTEYISIALNKQGFISGAYQNTATGESLEIRGSVDRKSQRAAWRFVAKEWPIMESGMYNLTKGESTLLVHFSEQRTEPRLLIRIEDQ